MIDLKQVSSALRNSTKRSLVLFDEVKMIYLSLEREPFLVVNILKTLDGVGLFCAVLDEFANSKENSPKVLAATHYHEIFEYGLLMTPHFKTFSMEIIEQENERTLTYLYK